MASLPSDIKAIFLDLDGTMYMGSNLIDGAHDFLERCKNKGVATFFLSNNSSRSVDQYKAKLQGFGIHATDDEILLSTHDLIAWLQANNVTQTWAVATKGMCEMLEGVGISTRSTTPQYVVVGYDTELTYEKSQPQVSIFMLVFHSSPVIPIWFVQVLMEVYRTQVRTL